jgi:hypothetical protein
MTDEVGSFATVPLREKDDEVPTGDTGDGPMVGESVG